jgi:hypothetical protein
MKENWEKFTKSTNFYNGQLIRHFVEGSEIQYKIIGLSAIEGFLEVSDYANNGSILPPEKQNKHNLAGWLLIDKNFEILIQRPSDDPNWPHNLDEAVRILINEMQNNDKEKIQKMSKLDFDFYSLGLGSYVRNKFGLWQGNHDLINDVDSNDPNPDNISNLILEAVYEELKKN